MSKNVPWKGLKPNKVADSVWAEVIECWENGLTDRETAFRVSRDTEDVLTVAEISRWKKEDPRVSELCEMLKDELKAIAKTNSAELLRAKDDKHTRWFLEKRCPEEYSTKAAVAFEGAVVELSLEEKESALKEMVERFKNGES